MTTFICRFLPTRRTRPALAAAWLAVLCSVFAPGRASADDQVYFSATDNIANVLIQRINAETVRIDMSAWYLTERAVTTALLNRFNAGVQVRLIGDRGSIFEIDPFTRREFYYLASRGVPIRLRYHPTWYPEIDHWKATIFVGQNRVAFGSANYTPFELVPWSSTNYKDEVVLLTDDSSLVNAFKTKFDKYWNDTTTEPQSLQVTPPFFRNWNDACALEAACADYAAQYPNPAPMIINTNRLEPDYPLPNEMVWAQGSSFNNRLVQSINAESSAIDFVIYRLTVDNITNALLARHQAGVPMRLIMEPNEYLNRKWPEFWITHANIDKLWAAGIPIKKRLHDGLTHMKTLITSSTATIASSNFAAAWQRDHNYFVPAATKPAIYQAVKNRFQTMWNDAAGFGAFVPQPPDAPILSSPANGSTAVAQPTALSWQPAPFAVNFDVYLGTSPSAMTVVGNVAALLVNSPPATYSWTPSSSLQAGVTYYWKVVSRTNATPVNPSLIAPSPIWSFTTAGAAGPPAAPSNPTPSNGATGVGINPVLGWSGGGGGATFNVAFGTNNPPTTVVATNLTSPAYSTGALSASTTYYWRITAVWSGGNVQGPVWAFTTGTGGGGTASEIVIYADDLNSSLVGWSKVSDSTAARGIKLRNADAGAAVIEAPRANPSAYFDATFQAQAGTRYRVWMRIKAIGDSKFNDSVFVQFSDSVSSSGSPTYRIGSVGGYTVNLWTCSTCQSFGWGWQRNAYWLSDTGDVWFQNTGQHTMRVQVREDGVEIDQIVLSPTTYASSAPGPVSNDTTIVPKPSGVPAPGTPGSNSPANGASGVSLAATLTWSAANATAYDVMLGVMNPPTTVAGSGLTSPSYAPPNLEADRTYYWRVIARNSGGSTSGPVWSFRTATMPPDTPNSPIPANGAINVATNTTLQWVAAHATSYDVLIDTSDPPSQVAHGISVPSFSTSLAPNTTYFWQIVAHNSTADVQGPVWSFTTAAAAPPPIDEIVLYASDVLAADLHGWTKASDSSSPGGIKVVTPDNGVSFPNSPGGPSAQSFDVTFNADPAKTYTLWLRLKALNNSKFNDAVWVQFSGALANGQPVYPLQSSSALLVNLATDGNATSLNSWGWANGAYWLSQPRTFTFASGGLQRMRIQIREDGVQIDQIVLSHVTYLNAPPGPPTNDATIVVKP